MFRHACAMGLEGIISKRADGRYKSGRCLSWVKVKNPNYERRGVSGHSRTSLCLTTLKDRKARRALETETIGEGPRKVSTTSL
jgi:ATP-dependent DNA ligase